MSNAILLSIHLKWAQKIYSGEKTVEWRKVIPSCLIPVRLAHKPMRVYLYETAPVKKVTGYFVCKDVARLEMSEPPWENAEINPAAEKVINEGCVPLDDLKKYAGKKAVVYGLKVLYCSKFFNGPKSLEDFGLKRPPQSWQYVDEDALVTEEQNFEARR